MSGKVVKSKRGKSRLIQTSSKSGNCERVKPSLAQTVPLGSSFALKNWLFVIALIAAVFLVYHPVWHAGFIWDDDTFLVNNPLIKLSNGLYQFWFTTKASDFYPLTFTTLWLEWRLWGGTNPLGYHIVNVLLHALSAVLIWRVLAHLRMPGAWLAAALFAVHPVNVQSVAWITELKNTLAMLFYVTSLLFYLRFEDTARWRWYGMALGFFVFALLSKTAAVPLPIVLLGLAWWQRDRVSSRDVRLTLPFFGIALLLGLITVWFQYHSIGSEIVRADSFWSRLAGAGWAVWFYLYKALLPVNLIFVYTKWQIDATKLLSYVPGLLVLACAVFFLRFRKGWGKAWLFGLGYFVVMLLPVLGFLNIYFMRYSLVADHWQYFSIIGPIGLVAAGITWASDRLKKRNVFLVPVFSAILLLVLGVLTWRQTCNYSDVETLWNMTIARNPACWMAYNNRGNVYKDLGNYRQAIEDYDRAIEINPGFAAAYNNRGIAYKGLGNYRQTMEDYNRAIESNPDYAEAYNNRGNAYKDLGNYRQAIEDYNRAIEINPGFAAAYMNRGNTYNVLGNYRQAIEDYNRTIEIKPDYAASYNNRGAAYSSLGNYKQAIEDYDRAIEIKPDFVEAYCQRGIAYGILGNNNLGCRDLRKACELGNCKLLEAATTKGLCR
jgi:tetratricopeptide (TPR) repeat protein